MRNEHSRLRILSMQSQTFYLFNKTTSVLCDLTEPLVMLKNNAIPEERVVHSITISRCSLGNQQDGFVRRSAIVGFFSDRYSLDDFQEKLCSNAEQRCQLSY